MRSAYISKKYIHNRSLKHCMLSHLMLAFAVLSLGAPAQSQAETRPNGYDLNLFSGFWDGTRNVDTSPYLGFGASYHISRVFSLDLNHGLIPAQAVKTTELDEINPEKEDLNIQQGALNFVINLAPGNFVPFFSVGVGWLIADQDSSWLSDVGFGAKYYLNDDFALKASAIFWTSDMNLRAEPYDHVTFTMGISYSIAGDRDIDKDSVKNTIDKCPTKAEDKDGFEDGDGCPDDDNDKDGIKDEVDQCPDEAEDEDDDRDEDGCPDLDDDNDGISNEEDKCPNQPEDQDGFKDDDGCLDEDNDKDGILDTKDRCPNEPESMNNFQDKDGCPEFDKDNDQVFDSVDRCKSKPETHNGLNDGDGCPDEISNELQSLLGLQEKIRFSRNKSKPKLSRKAKESLKVLAEKLKAENLNVTITATAHKTKDMNALSLDRAKAIIALLRELGVKASQMQAVGKADAVLPTNLEVKKGQPKENWVSVTPWLKKVTYKKASIKSTKKTKEAKVEKKASIKSTKKTKEAKVEKKAAIKSTKKTEEAKVEKKAAIKSTKKTEEAKVEKKASIKSTKKTEEAKVEKKAAIKSTKKTEEAKVEKKASIKSTKETKEAKVKKKAAIKAKN